MTEPRTPHLRLAGSETPARAPLLSGAPAGLEGHLVIGPEVDGWSEIAAGPTSGGPPTIELQGVPEALADELRWMIWWTIEDGSTVNCRSYQRFTNMIREQAAHGEILPRSLADRSWDSWQQHLAKEFARKHGRLPSANRLNQIRGSLKRPLLALRAATSTEPWWRMPVWSQRLDRRVPRREREPFDSNSVNWEGLEPPWLRQAGQWFLGSAMESRQMALASAMNKATYLRAFGRWLVETGNEAAFVSADREQARMVAHSYRNHARRQANKSASPKASSRLRLFNDRLIVVEQLLYFIVDHQDEVVDVLGDPRWLEVSELHPALWARQKTRTVEGERVSQEHFLDSTAMTSITRLIHILGASTDETFAIQHHDGQIHEVRGFGDPQIERMVLVQRKTGRRASEIRLTPENCIEVLDRPGQEDSLDVPVARFTYGQSKIDGAPDTILVDAETVAIVREQQEWLREQHPAAQPQYLFVQRTANRRGLRPYSADVYYRTLRRFSAEVDLRDGAGKSVTISNTHRFRHTRLTNLAQMHVAPHVLQRYAGHRSVTMTMHYIGHQHEFEEQEFLATRRLTVDGRQIHLSQSDYDVSQLFDRTDRILPHGLCLLPPLQSCDKGNACLTCTDFVTDASKTQVLEAMATETAALISARQSAYQETHGCAMPEDHPWFVSQRTTLSALTTMLTRLAQSDDSTAIRGAGSNARAESLATVSLGPTRRRSAVTPQNADSSNTETQDRSAHRVGGQDVDHRSATGACPELSDPNE